MADEDEGGSGKGGLIGVIAAGLALGPMAISGIAALLIVGVVVSALTSALGGAVGGIFGDDNVRRQIGLDPPDGCSTGPGGNPVTGSQRDYVRTIIGVAKGKHIPEKGEIIAVMVALQESGVQNLANNGKNVSGIAISTPPGTQFWLNVAKKSMSYPHDGVGSDGDSVGVFQQRASSGWADSAGFKATSDPAKAAKRLLDPQWTAAQFFGGAGGSANRGLLDVSGWELMSNVAAAQKVQGSMFPGAYAKWESKAKALVAANQDAPAITGGGGGGGGGDDKSSTAVQYPMKAGTYTLTSGFGKRTSPGGIGSTWHLGQDFGTGPNHPTIYAIADGTVAAAGPTPGFGSWVVINHKLDGQTVSSVYGHMRAETIKVKKGDTVTKGQPIAKVDHQGNSTGNHLHFEIWPGGRFSAHAKAIDPMPWLKEAHASGGGGGGGSCGNENAVPGDAKAIVAFARKYIGTPYSWGGGGLNGPSYGVGIGADIKGFDCSGLTRYAVYQASGKKLIMPRVATEQWSKYRKYKVPANDRSKWKVGDLMVYSSDGGNFMHHIAIYAGHGKMVEAPHPGAKVREIPVYTSDLYALFRVPFDHSKKAS